ncbi:MAG: choline ABC transporter ATP-binding protein [Pseudomonadota bacterium]
MSVAVSFRHVDVVFGDNAQEALPLVDQGVSRAEILERTGAVLGARDATLDVPSGGIVVLMGLSGSGKSTLLRCVNGLNKVTRGQLLVEGEHGPVDVASCGQADLRRIRQHRVAMVFQQFALLPWRTVRENVGFGLELRGAPKREIDDRVAEMLTLVDLDGWGDKYAHELSGGMQQRVGLARAFATDAPILLMDEPFSALDPLIRVRLQDELLDLQERLKKTVIFVSHDLDEAMKLGNRIAIMEGGDIVQFSTPEGVLLNPANDYVADFVANLNPLNVLTARTLMTPLETLARDGETYLVEDASDWRLMPGDDGLRCGRNGETMALSSSPTAGQLFAVSPEISLRDAVELHRLTREPLVVMDNGKPIGVLCDTQLFDGILKRIDNGT